MIYSNHRLIAMMIITIPRTMFTVLSSGQRVHPVHALNAEQRQAAADAIV